MSQDVRDEPRTERGPQPATPHERAREGTLRTPIAGYRFAARPPGADHPRPGQGVLLHHERGHPMDEWAVAIWTRAENGIPWRIGYLERALAARIGPRIRDGRRVIGEVVGWMTEPDGRWRRPVIEVDRDDIEATAGASSTVTVGGAPVDGETPAPATAGVGQSRKTA